MRDGLGRRELLLGAGAGAVALATLGVPTAAAADTNQPDNNGGGSGGLRGAWGIKRTDADGPANAVVTFADGGAFATRDLRPAGPPGFGSWKQTGQHSF